MAGSGFDSKGNFRKIMSDRAIKSKYPTIVTTAEEMLAQKIQAEMEQQMEQDRKSKEEMDEEEVDISQIKRAAYTVDDIMSGMDKQMKIEKKKKNKKD